MLLWSQVLDYVKGQLSLPSTFIEDTDGDIQNWLKMTAIKEFSTYMPDVERVSVIWDNPNYQHPTRNGNFYIFDEDNCEIIGIKECYFPQVNSFFTGHPPFGTFSFEGMKWWSLSVFKSRFFSKFTSFNFTYKFIPPNIVEVMPSDQVNDNFVVEYERNQPSDLRKIPTAMHMTFMDLCLAHMMLKLGNMRSHFGDGKITTPFGEIPLNGETLKSEGKEMREKIVEKLIEESMPAVFMDVN